MITKNQQKWLNHLRADDHITIAPYDSKTSAIFEKVRTVVLDVLGKGFEVLHRGSSYLHISGQDEIDIYVPVDPDMFDFTVSKMSSKFGEPRSLYPLVRARFKLDGYDKRIDVFVINKKDAGWIDSEVFTTYLLSHPNILDKYRMLKESGNGLSTKAYYTRKIEFINGVLAKAKQE